MVTDNDVIRLRVDRSGLFLPSRSIGELLQEGEEIGKVLEPASGVVRQRITAPHDGVLMALRNQPVVSPGIMVARLWKGR